MEKHQKDAKSPLVKFLYGRDHFSALDMRLKEQEMINKELMSNVPTLLSFNQQKVRKEVAMRDELEPREREGFENRGES